MPHVTPEKMNEIHRKKYEDLARGTVTGRFSAARPHNHAQDAVRYTGYTTVGTHDAHCHEVQPHPVHDLPTLVEEQVNEAIAHLVSELDGMAQRCEELDIELECMRNAFPEHDHDVMPKRRGNFTDY